LIEEFLDIWTGNKTITSSTKSIVCSVNYSFFVGIGTT